MGREADSAPLLGTYILIYLCPLGSASFDFYSKEGNLSFQTTVKTR